MRASTTPKTLKIVLTPALKPTTESVESKDPPGANCSNFSVVILYFLKGLRLMGCHFQKRVGCHFLKRDFLKRQVAVLLEDFL
jgi:hypothetical protein